MHNVLRVTSAKHKEMVAWLATQQRGNIYGRILKKKTGYPSVAPRGTLHCPWLRSNVCGYPAGITPGNQRARYSCMCGQITNICREGKGSKKCVSPCDRITPVRGRWRASGLLSMPQ